MAKNHTENKKTAMIKAFLCLISTVILYFAVFERIDQITEILRSKTYYAPITSIIIVLLAAFLYGTATSIILKHTLQEKLKSQQLREE